MPSSYRFEKKFDSFDSILHAERARLGLLVADKAKEAAAMMATTAPVSNINYPGYVHFAQQFFVEQITAYNWGIRNEKVVNGYELWKLLEYGTYKMSPRKTIGPVMDIIGPQFLEAAGRLTK